MPNESANLKLKLYDPDVDTNTLVYDFIKDTAGYTNSNFVKIDTNINNLYNHIIGTDGNVVFYNKQEVFLAVHPVGSIFLSTNGTEPAELYGGTWEQIKDVFLLGAGDTYAAGSTGGSENHNHSLGKMIAAAYFNGLYVDYNYSETIKATWTTNYRNTIPNGKTEYLVTDAHPSGVTVYGYPTEEANNMPPYIAMYIWRRIA